MKTNSNQDNGFDEKNYQSTQSLQEVTQLVIIEQSDFNSKGSEEAKQFQSCSTDNEAQNENNQNITNEQRSNIFVWGNNQNGQLSLTNEMPLVQDPVAIKLSQINKIESVACGASHTLIVNEAGFLFAMGDNSFGQLGLSNILKKASRQPIMVQNLVNSARRQNMTVSKVCCSANSSFAALKASTAQASDELYSWGATKDGILGHKVAKNIESVPFPTKVEFTATAACSNAQEEEDADDVLRIEHVSVGESHAALLTQTHQVYFWGTNSMGQLGLSDTDARPEPFLNSFVAEQETIKVSCGNSFTFLISGVNEIMISGKLPFAVQNEQGQEQDFIATFQSIAQFDQRVNIMQVEASRFASIVVDPVEEGQPKELFLWGQSPLGVFNELTPLNQLFASSYEQSEHQTFNVKAVKNGLNFCVFVDQDSGMTYQVGAENMIDPYVDDALVSLSELRDAQFSDISKFSCGSNFVIGESAIAGIVVAESICPPLKNAEVEYFDNNQQQKFCQQQPRLSPQMMISAIKEQAAEIEMSMQLVSPGSGSKQSFPQRALYQGSISPSTPTQNGSLNNNSCSGFKSMQYRHKDLNMGGTALIKHIDDGCKPVLTTTDGTPKMSANSQSPKKNTRSNVFEMVSQPEHESEVEVQVTEEQNEEKCQGEIIDQQTPSESETETVPEVVQSPASKKSDEKVSMSMIEAGNMCYDDQENTTSRVETTPITASKVKEYTQQHQFQTQMKNETKPTFSPEVSPINGVLLDTMQESHIDNTEQAWMDATYHFPNNISTEISAQQMPLQMQHNSHMVYQSYPAPFPMRSPDHGNFQRDAMGNSRACYLPVQQMGRSSLQGTPSQQQQQVQMHHAYGTVGQLPTYPQQATTPLTIVQQPSVSQSQLNASGFLNMSQHQNQFQQQQEQQHSFYELMMNEKLECATLSGQLKEAQRQLDKSRKAYAKLLSQVDEDSSETAALREQARKQEIQIGDVSAKFADQVAIIERVQGERAKLELELKQSSARFQSIQGELAATQLKVKEAEGRLLLKQQKCTSEVCRKGMTDFEMQLQRKSKEIYDLTVKLGCLESENVELKCQIQDKNQVYETRMDSSRLIAEQDLYDARRSISELTEALTQQQSTNKAKVSHRAVQTKPNQEDEDFPNFHHSIQKVKEKVMTIPVIPIPCYEAINEVQLAVEAEQSFDISINFNQQEEQFSSSLGPDGESIGDQSLQEFKFIEKAAAMPQRQSMELPRVFGAPIGQGQQRITSNQKMLKSQQRSQASDNEEPIKIKHNFMNNNKQTASYEPQILRKSNQKSSSRNLMDRTSQQKIDQNRSTNFAPNFAELKEKSREIQDNSMFQMGEQSNDAENSWQTFKPSTVCPNDRYSLKRHQEIFMESQNSQKDESAEDLSNMENTARRAKSNSDAGCLQIQSQKNRRLRHQRQAMAVKKSDENSCGEEVSQRSFGAKSNLTTPMRAERQAFTQRGRPAGLQPIDDEEKQMTDRGSQLKRPTRMTKSPSTNAILQEMDESRARLLKSTSQFNITTLSTKNTDLEKQLIQPNNNVQQPCQTPAARHNISNSGFFSAKRNSAAPTVGGNQVIIRPKVYSHLKASSRPNMTARPQVSSQPGLLQIQQHQQTQQNTNDNALYQSQSMANLQNNQFSSRQSGVQYPQPAQTPRVKSQGTLQGNAGSILGRQSQQQTRAQQQFETNGSNLSGRNTVGGGTVNSQHASATARRVAYDARRKLAMQTMKAMTKSATMTAGDASSINRQARIASAQIVNPAQDGFANTHQQLESFGTTEQLYNGFQQQSQSLIQTTPTIKQPDRQQAVLPHHHHHRSTQMSITTEEPFAHPPLQTQQPEMSVHQESSTSTDLPMQLSARQRLTARTDEMMNSDEQQEASNLFHQTQQIAAKIKYEEEMMLLQLYGGGQSAQTTAKPNQQKSTSAKVADARGSAQQQCQSSVQRNKSGRSCKSGKSDGSPYEDQSHLIDMKDKLHKIQSNKMLLEKKIQEYETKLKKISQDKSTQQIWAKAQQNSNNAYNTSSSGVASQHLTHSTDNIFADQSPSDYTLGDTQQINASTSRHDKRQRKSQLHIFSTQERQQRQHRTAFQQLTNNANTLNNQITSSVLSSQHNSSKISNNTSSAAPFRDCQMKVSERPVNRIKAPAAVRPQTHYTNQAIFRP